MSAPIVWRGFPFSPFTKLTVYFILLTNSMEHNHSRETRHRSAIQEIPVISLNWKVHCHVNFLVSCAIVGKRGKELRLKLIVDSTVRVSVNMDDTINRSPGSSLTKGSPRRTAVWHKQQHSIQRYAHERSGKGKSVPLQAWSGPEGSRKLRFPDFMTTAQEGGKVVSLTHRTHLPAGSSPGTHFC